MMVKNHLYNIKRTFYQFNKSEYDFVLDQSERILPFSEESFKKFINSLNQKDFLLYPNLNEFYSFVESFYGVGKNKTFVSDGSDSAIKSVFEAFVTPNSNIVTTNPSFPMYGIYSQLYQSETKTVNYDENFKLKITDIIKKVDKNTSLIILANPNSPFGDYYKFSDIKKILELNIPTLIDEAYIEFSNKKSLIEKIDEYDNLIVSRTISKAMGGAGVRCGFIFSSERNIEIISKFRKMYEVTGPTIKYFKFLIDNYDEVDTYIKGVLLERKRIEKILKKENINYHSSYSNWIHIDISGLENEVDLFLKKYKILIKTIKFPNNKSIYLRWVIQPNQSLTQYFKEFINLVEKDYEKN